MEEIVKLQYITKLLNVASADWFLSDAFPFRLFVTSPRICLGLDT